MTVTVVNKTPNATVVNASTTSTVSASAQRGSTGPTGPQGVAGAPGVSAVFTMQDQLAVYTGKSRFYFDNSYTLTKIRASVGTAPTGSAVTVQLLLNGTVIATVSIPAGANTATATLSQTVAVNDYATVSVTSVGSTTPGADLTVSLNVQ